MCLMVTYLGSNSHGGGYVYSARTFFKTGFELVLSGVL